MPLPILLNEAINAYKMAMSHQYKAFEGQEGGVEFGVAADTHMQRLCEELCRIFVLFRVNPL